MIGALADRVAVVTGASRGLGQAIAGVLLARGAHVVLAARDGAALRSVARELASRCVDGQNVLPVVTDVARPADVERLVARTRAAHSRGNPFGHLSIAKSAVNGLSGASSVPRSVAASFSRRSTNSSRSDCAFSVG